MFTWFPLLLNGAALVATLLVLFSLLALAFRLARGERLINSFFGTFIKLLALPYTALAAALDLASTAMRHLVAGILAMAPEGRRSEAGVLAWYLVMPFLVMTLGALLVITGVAFDAVRFSGLLGGNAVATDPSALGTELAVAYGLGGILCVLLLADVFGHSVLGRGTGMWFAHIGGRLLTVARGMALATFAMYIASAVFLAIWSSSPDAIQAADAFLFCYVLALVGVIMLAGAALAHCFQAVLVIVLAAVWLSLALLRLVVAVPVRMLEGVRDLTLSALAVLADLALLALDPARRRAPAGQLPAEEPVGPPALPEPIVLHRRQGSIPEAIVEDGAIEAQERHPA